jgi:1-aminocyclopropane-1-carboxylate deaminase/D-cysteine desulfhydrase-like pyridoxal-dependent ACC family enzyme
LIDSCLSGNKYRKLEKLVLTPSEKYCKLISFGGVQSNAMYSLSCLAKSKNWEFHYYSKVLPSYLKHEREGNFKLALDNGMIVHECDDYDRKIDELKSGKYDNETLFISQGGADKIASVGVENLAKEIREFKLQNNIDKLNIITPSGTGTTSFYIATFLSDMNIYTTPSVGDEVYLKSQMQKLGDIPTNLCILNSKKKYHFGKLYSEFIELYYEFLESDIEFDLLYAMKMWNTLFENIESIDGDILYVHSGGLSGNESMLKRYKYRGFTTQR